MRFALSLTLALALCACSSKPESSRPTVAQPGGEVTVRPAQPRPEPQLYVHPAPPVSGGYVRPEETLRPAPADRPVWEMGAPSPDAHAARVDGPSGGVSSEPFVVVTAPDSPSFPVAEPAGGPQDGRSVSPSVASLSSGGSGEVNVPAGNGSPSPALAAAPASESVGLVAPGQAVAVRGDMARGVGTSGSGAQDSGAAGLGVRVDPAAQAQAAVDDLVRPDGGGMDPPPALPAPLPGGPAFGALEIGQTLRAGSGARRVVALTFDDGPWGQQTGAVLDILASRGVKATFFMLGSQVQAQPSVVRQVQQAGHEIGAHTWSHPASTRRLNAAQSRWEVENTSRAIEALTGTQVKLMRPSGGGLASGPALAAFQSGQQVVLWNVDSRDWDRGATVAGVLRTTLAQVRPGSIILMHDGGGLRRATLGALPELIDALKLQGYEFVTVSGLN